MWFIVIVLLILVAYFLIRDYYPGFVSEIENYQWSEGNNQASGISIVTPQKGDEVTPPKRDELIEKCSQSYDNCVKIATTKFDALSVSLIKMEKFGNEEKAEEFLSTWHTMTVQPLGLWYYVDNGSFGGHVEESFFPMVLIAAKMTGPTGQVPVVLVCDNLNTHKTASFYEAFEPAEARRLIERLEIHYTPKHGSWLDIAEIELSVFTKQCLDRRIPDVDTLRKEAKAWYRERNAGQKSVDWQFTTDKARIKLKRLYPQIQML